MKYHMLQVLAIIGASFVIVPGAAGAADSGVVYEKTLDGGQRLVVSLDVRSGAVDLNHPSAPPAPNVYSYAFAVRGHDGPPKVLWVLKHTFVGTDPAVHAPVIFDVAVRDNTLVVLYHESYATYANVVAPNTAGGTNDLPRADARLLSDSNANGIEARGGRIDAADAGQVRVTVDGYGEKQFTFRLSQDGGKTRWVRDTPATQPAAPTTVPVAARAGGPSTRPTR